MATPHRFAGDTGEIPLKTAIGEVVIERHGQFHAVRLRSSRHTCFGFRLLKQGGSTPLPSSPR